MRGSWIAAAVVVAWATGPATAEAARLCDRVEPSCWRCAITSFGFELPCERPDDCGAEQLCIRRSGVDHCLSSEVVCCTDGVECEDPPGCGTPLTASDFEGDGTYDQTIETCGDGGVIADAAVPTDAGIGVDGGEERDAGGAEEDGGRPRDAGGRRDAGAKRDAGGERFDAGAEGTKGAGFEGGGGCALAPGPDGEAGALAVAAALALLAWRRRRAVPATTASRRCARPGARARRGRAPSRGSRRSPFRCGRRGR